MEHRDYSGAIHWQAAYGVPVATVARLFGKSESSVPVITWRASQGFQPRATEKILADIEKAGASADSLLLSTKNEDSDLTHLYKPTEIESRIDAFASRFWEKVRDRKGAKELGLLLRRVSKPAFENLPLRRQAARLYHLLSEIYLHAGYCRSALLFAARAYRAEQELYRETLSKDDLFSIGKTSLLISQALINRSEYESALPWLARSKQAFKAGSHKIDPEYFKQLGNVQFHQESFSEAAKNFTNAGLLLPDYGRPPTVAQVKDIGERHLNLVGNRPDWEKAFDLMEFAQENWPGDDIHKSLNVNWAAAAGLMIDSAEANQKAIELLRQKGHLSRGYLHPETVTDLLLMTPDLPKKIRPEWARFSLHYNAFRNK